MTSNPQSTERDGLLLNRDRLVRLLKDALYELHTKLLVAKKNGDTDDVLDLINYWETVLVWIKELGGQDVVVLSRR